MTTRQARLMAHNDGGYSDLHPFGRVHEGYVNIPESFRELYVDHFPDLETIAFSDKNLEKLRHLYTASFWMDNWYDDEASIWTPATMFYSWNESDNSDIIFETPKFARLNSVSAKPTLKLVDSLAAARAMLASSTRCQRSIEMARYYDIPIFIAIRDAIDVSRGNEYRCFIYRDNLVAVCSNDEKIANMAEDLLVTRCQQLLLRARSHLPFHACVMDVFLTDIGDENDQVIEFNSFGAWANCASGLFHWLEDEYILTTSEKGVVNVRLNHIQL